MKSSVVSLVLTLLLAASIPCAASTDPADSGVSHARVVPYIPYGPMTHNQAFFSFANYDAADTSVHLQLYDELGIAGPYATIAVPGRTIRWANSDDLLAGNVEKGITTLPGGSLRASALWALVEPDSSTTVVIAYLRSPAGFVVPLSRVARTSPAGASWWQSWTAVVPLVNPASNLAVSSVLRVVNAEAEPRRVGLFAIDAQGVPSNGIIECVVPAYGAVSLSSLQLETGSPHPACTGRGWGDGTGKWTGYVWDVTRGRDDPPVVMSLLYSVATGLVTNVSAPLLPDAPAPDHAPPSAAAFVEHLGDDVLSLQPADGADVGTSSSEYRFTLSAAHSSGGAFTREDSVGDSAITGTWQYRKAARPRALAVPERGGDAPSQDTISATLREFLTLDREGRSSTVVPQEGAAPPNQFIISARQRALLILDHDGRNDDGGVCETELEFTDLRRGNVSMLCHGATFVGGDGLFELAPPTL